jgi:co-chaperonin GroES (HSP10)
MILPINDHILLEIVPVEKKSGILILDAKEEVKLRIASLGAVADLPCKEGDYVRIEKYKGTEIELSDKRYIIIHHKDIIAYEPI